MPSISNTYLSLTASMLAAASLLPSDPAQAGAPAPQTHGLLKAGVQVTAVSDLMSAKPGVRILQDPQGGGISRIYGAAFSHGANPVDSAGRFLAEHADVLSSDLAQLMPIGPNGDGAHVVSLGYNPDDDSYRFSLVGYTQHVNGIPVFRGDVRLLVRNEPGYPLVLVSNGLRDVRAFAAGFTGKPVPPSKIDVNRISRRALSQFGPGATVSEQEQVIWAGYDGAPAAEPRLAFKFVVTGTDVFDRHLKQRMLYVVDAATNELLFEEDQILRADINAIVRGNATQGTVSEACAPEVPTALPYARVTVGTTQYFADASGMVAIPNPSGGSLTLTSSLATAGRWFVVNDVAGTESVLSQGATAGSVEFLHNAANTDQSERAEVNAYLHANIVRDYLLSFNPAFPSIPAEQGFKINVMSPGWCANWYDGSSINFNMAVPGCNNAAFSTTVYHEYAHHIVSRAGSGQGPYGEGFSDAMAVIITDESRLAVGLNNCGTGIRDAANTVQYTVTGCSSAGSLAHQCGTLFSGCIWSTRSYLAETNPSNYRETISSLMLDSVLLHTGVSITPAITIDFLTLDDDDANLNNGTPHFAQIDAGFGDHNMPAPTLQLVSTTFPNGRPDLSSPVGDTSFPVVVAASSSEPIPGTGVLRYRIGSDGPFSTAPLTATGTNEYLVTLPAAPCGSTLQYYIETATASNLPGLSPLEAPDSFYETLVSVGPGRVTFFDSVESDLGWTLSAADDTATVGGWERGDPVGEFVWGSPFQTEVDVTADPGVNCFFTGQGVPNGQVGEADVDGGRTTLTSPVMDASGAGATISYYRWYHNINGTSTVDGLRVQLSNDDGATWVPVETVGPSGVDTDGGWVFKSFRVGDFVEPTDRVRIRFIAEDLGADSFVEAAIDEVSLVLLSCEKPSDINGDGSTNGADLVMLLGAWGTNGPTDLDSDTITDGSDLAILISNWS